MSYPGGPVMHYDARDIFQPKVNQRSLSDTIITNCQLAPKEQIPAKYE